MDDEDAIGVASTLMEDQTLNGLASSVYVEANTGYVQYLDGGAGRRRLPRLRVARPRPAGALVSAAVEQRGRGSTSAAAPAPTAWTWPGS